MKNVVFFLYRFPGDGGIERVTTCIASVLYDIGIKVFVVSTIRQQDVPRPSNLPLDVPVVQIQDKGYLREFLIRNCVGTIVYQDCYATNLKYLVEETNELPIRKIVVEHNTPDAFLHTLEYTNIGQSKIKTYLRKLKIRFDIYIRHRMVYSWSDVYVLLSANYIGLFKKITKLDNLEKLKCIPNPVTIPIPAKIIKKDTAKQCLFVGRLNVQKGIPYLLEIWNFVAKKKQDWQLVIVGMGEEQDLIDTYIQEHPDCRIRCEGFTNNVEQYYEASDMLLMTSVFEGWPLVLFEAMAYGCVPVLFNSYLAANEIVTDGVDGFLLEPFDISKYTERVLELMKNETKLAQMRCNAIQKANRYTVDNIIRYWKEIL